MTFQIEGMSALLMKSRVEIANCLPYYKFAPNLENYYLATTWRMSWMRDEANLLLLLGCGSLQYCKYPYQNIIVYHSECRQSSKRNSASGKQQ